jgi:predicted SprT family Zn-dependent metalloprotease
MQREGNEKIEKGITKQMKLTLEKILGKDAISKFRFGVMKNMGGYAQGTTMVINRAYLPAIARTIMNRFSIYLYDNYEAGDRTKGMSFLFKMLKSNDREVLNVLLKDMDSAIDKIVSIVVHEAVHLVQHKQQAHRPGGKTEYRSYLDKTKGEFYGHAMKSTKTKNKDRYYDLYYASPQEIAAFAHQMALDVIKANGLDKVERLQDIPRIESEDIISYINNRISNRFAEPRNPQEVQVRRRYLKLVYQEVHRYIEHLHELLNPSRGVKK